MLIAILVVAGVALLTRGAKAVNEVQPAEGQFSTTGLASTATAAVMTPRGISTFTPSEQTPSIVESFPTQLVGTYRADPSITSLVTTFENGRKVPTQLVGMLSQQRFLNGGYK